MGEEFDELADQVAILSTKLVTEVAKSLELEESLVQLRKESSHLKSQVGKLSEAAKRTQSAESRLKELEEKHQNLEKAHQELGEKNRQLEGEVEDLTASLFTDAMKMVSEAREEKENYIIKNRKLNEEIGEKDRIIDNLQEQLQDLKGLFMKLEDQQRSSKHGTPQLEHGFEGDSMSNQGGDEYTYLMSQLIYAPRVRAIRFDLANYQQDFKAFVFQVIKPDFTFDLTSLKNLKYFRKIWHEELEPALGYVPSVSNNLLNRFSKGKTFWTLLVEGKAIIEPVSGVNETFKLNYRGLKTGDEKPVAMKDPCTFCGESKGDRLEHARLYTLKLYGPASETTFTENSSTTLIGGEAHEVIGTYPLCNFCLVKLRAICEFFAKLRLVHANVYKLQQNSTFDDLAVVSQFQFKKYDDRTNHDIKRYVSKNDEAILLKLYYLLLTIRAKIFWSKIGFWDTEEDSETVTVDEAHIEMFQRMVRENVAFGTDNLEAIERPQSVNGYQSPKSGQRTPKTVGTPRASVIAKEQTEEGSGDEEFADSSAFADAETHESPLRRRKSKSKAFKAKIDKDLSSTMKMLQESLDENERREEEKKEEERSEVEREQQKKDNVEASSNAEEQDNIEETEVTNLEKSGDKTE